MNSQETLLPRADDISDETAAVLTELLFRLADMCEMRYGSKIHRYSDVKQAEKIDKQDRDRDRLWLRDQSDKI